VIYRCMATNCACTGPDPMRRARLVKAAGLPDPASFGPSVARHLLRQAGGRRPVQPVEVTLLLARIVHVGVGVTLEPADPVGPELVIRVAFVLAPAVCQFGGDPLDCQRPRVLLAGRHSAPGMPRTPEHDVPGLLNEAQDSRDDECGD
jgi:hypothetical protein